MIHIELNYPSKEKPTEAQYTALVELYVAASNIYKKNLSIVPHLEIDRGIKGSHGDPSNFDFNHFYDLLKKRGVDVDSVDREDQQRYLIPNQGDQKQGFPPTLHGTHVDRVGQPKKPAKAPAHDN